MYSSTSPLLEPPPSQSDLHPAEQLMARAIALGQQGDAAQAEQILRGLLAQSPDCPPVLHNLAVCLIQQDRSDEAHEHLREALRLNPGYDRAHHSLGTLLHRQRNFEPAERHLRQAIAINPSNAEALNDLGALLNDGKHFEEAEIWLRQAVRMRPELADAYNNLGVSLTSLGRLHEARHFLRKGLDLRPHDAAAHANLGNAYKEEGRPAEAMACYELSLALTPNCIPTRWNRSLALLQAGDFERGWLEYEWRWRRPQTPPRHFTQPAWRGEPLHGRTILLYAEQGLGDTLQFIRYGSILKQQMATVIFECPHPLVRVLQNSPAFDLLVCEGDPVPAFDFHAPLMSLPRLCHTTLATIPVPVPYVQARPDDMSNWAGAMSRMSDPENLRVGITWQGNPHHPWDRFRSVPLREFTRLGCLRGVTFFSLQTGPGTEQIAELSGRARQLRLVQPWPGAADGPADMADIAAIMRNLDLVITVDTATAHLAGALGVQVWILVAAISDWRWMRNRLDSPWYPTARLFRQARLGSWASTFRDLHAELRHELERRQPNQGVF